MGLPETQRSTTVVKGLLANDISLETTQVIFGSTKDSVEKLSIPKIKAPNVSRTVG